MEQIIQVTRKDPYKKEMERLIREITDSVNKSIIERIKENKESKRK